MYKVNYKKRWSTQGKKYYKPKKKSNTIKRDILYKPVIIEEHKNSYWIKNYYEGACKPLENWLGVWDFRSRSYNIRYYAMDHDQHIMYIPKRFPLKRIMELIEGNSRLSINDIVTVDDSYKKRDTEFEIYKHIVPRDQIQEETIEFMNDGVDTKLVRIDVGFGKTICGIYTTRNIGHPALIISKNLSDNWIKEIDKCTTCYGHSQIVKISGTAGIRKLVQSKKKHTGIFYVISHATIRSCHKNAPELLPLLGPALGLGMIIIDEVHEELRSVILSVSLLQVERMFYFSATPYKRKNEDHLFQFIVGRIRSYGTYTQTINKYNIIIGNWNSNPLSHEISVVDGTRGVDSNIYSDYLFNNPDFEQRRFKSRALFRFFKYLTNVVLRSDPTARVLIYMPTKKGIHIIGQQFEADPTISGTVGYYCGLHDDLKRPGTKTDELKHNIIFTTLGSAKTGLNVQGLRLIILYIFIKLPSAVLQVMGRLRAIFGKEVYFADVKDTGFDSIVAQFRTKKSTIYNKKVKDKFIIVDYNAEEDTYESRTELVEF